MLQFDVDNNRFNFRVAAVVIHSNHVLLHRVLTDDFWALPGGRVEFFETSDDAVLRELEEELGLKASIVRHLWHVENFFDYGGRKFHEVGNYFLTCFDREPEIKSELDFKGIENDIDLIFRWVPIVALDRYVLKPGFLKSGIPSLPEAVEYIKINNLNSI